MHRDAAVAARGDRDRKRYEFTGLFIEVTGLLAGPAQGGVALDDIGVELAEAADPEGALVTIDAMGCQVEIADKIVAHKADYLLPLKGNQPTLAADVEDYFRAAPVDELVSKTTVEKGHGRIETPRVVGDFCGLGEWRR
jgi:hypothetical protein